MLEDVGNPLGVPLVRFLPPNGFHIFGVGEDDVAGGFQNVINRNPILPSGFHAHILAVVLRKPIRTPSQIPSEGGKTFALVGCHTLLIGRSNTGNDKRFVDIHPTADTVNDFKHNTSLKTIFKGDRQGLAAH